jgi:RNA methyltransferase, TrmH family
LFHKMLSKSQIKKIKSLESKKFRDELGMFVAEGFKITSDLIREGWPVEKIYLTEGTQFPVESRNVEWISRDEMAKISMLKNPSEYFCVCRMKVMVHDFSALRHSLVLALDDVQDPGNVGTIIRIADWFGIRDIFCSSGTAELYNPKVIQATMGAFTCVRVHEVSLPEFIPEYKKQTGNPVFGTLLDGENLYEKQVSVTGMIVMGSEGQGIHENLRKFITDKIYIPPFGKEVHSSESLNVAVAAAIVCAEFRRQQM